MIPKNGFNIKTSISYELNSIFEEFKVNQDYGGFIESLTSHNTFRYKLELSNNWLLNSNYNISFTNNFKYFHLSNYKVDDFLYFFGGGLEGLQGYTFYEPTLQGPRQIIFSNKFFIIGLLFVGCALVLVKRREQVDKPKEPIGYVDFLMRREC